MTFDQILTFVTIYRTGSISKAAEKLYLPQPTVSHRIKQLERELGKPLLIRVNGTVRLSQEGHTFLPFALSALTALDQGREAIEQLEHGLTGTLSLGCNNSFAGTMLPPILESFLAMHPGIALKVRCYSTEEQIKMLKSKHIQIGITRYTANDPSITFKLLYAHPAYAVISREHPYAERDELSLEEVLKERLILYEAESLHRKKIDMTFKDLNMLYDPHYETNNLQLIKFWIKSTMGVFLSCPLYMQPEIDSGEMVAIPIEHNPFPMNQIFLMYRDENLNSLDRLFMRHLEQYMGGYQSEELDDQSQLDR
ncbi:LysR family transcriptional regulator [Paenibacillus sp. OAS669]|uniref:LysR family transcriptional regulator n=1 Tax=Paenibacillus sp. OAS669 TaxID=2663821 RepID=UPI001789E22A|nr:LysR family transcriptional regulator [Paenibacillus sp. OAS669]MBE1444791.1 DNA-binding transcriptional LysR family regulator [Paenibacillus sp. OAS669]